MHHSHETLGGLACHIVDSASCKPDLLVVLCHGYGAPGQDLVDLAQPMMAACDGTRAVRFIFPEAPLDLRALLIPGGRAWWHLDMALLQQRSTDLAGFAQQLQDHVWPGLAPARKLLRRAIEQALQKAGLGIERLVLGGFSQGAMLTTDLALRLDEAPAGLIILSGALCDSKAWTKLSSQRGGLRVVQSHGTQDPILPMANAQALCALLRDSGNDVRFLPFDGGHTISPAAVAACAELIGRA